MSPRRFAGPAVLALVLALIHASPTAAARPPADPAALVNPFIGTGSGGPVVGEVDTFPGASLPFGMVQWSPDTPKRPSGGGYWYDDTEITGFSLTHLSGVGCPTGGDLPFLPWTGALPADPGAARLPLRHTDESASPGSYAVTAGGVRTELAVTARTGVARLTYPRTAQAQLLVKVAGSQNGSANAAFTAVGDRRITGSVTSGRFCGQPNAYTVYFAAVFDRPFTASGTWGGSAPVAAAGRGPASRRSVAPAAPVAGGFLTFDTRVDPVVRMKVAVSYVDIAGAGANLRAEAGTFDVAAARAAAHHTWNRFLGRIRVDGGTPDQRTQFATALYHSLLGPNLFSDADGRYLGFDARVHRVDPRHPQYANFSGWDVYRSEIPLLAMLVPGQTSDMMASLLRDADESGALPKWPVAAGHTDVMNGDPADPMLASAFAFGARGFDTRHAVDLMVRGAEVDIPPAQGFYVARPSRAPYLERGYVPNTRSTSISPVPNGASETLEYALDDFAVARLAAAVDRPGVAARFQARSQNWTNLFDTATGYIRPRDADGAFPPGAPVPAGGSGFGQSGFQESNAAQYTWMVPQNLRALADGMGGNAAAAARLDTYFTKLNVGPNEPFHWQGNEPTFGTPWAYNSVGQPWKTQATVRRILTELYRPVPGGEPGNDDVGALSSWYVWAALGLYPQTPGVPMLVVGAPLFPHAEIEAGSGRRVVIDAPGAAAGRPYVQSLRVNGHATTHTWLTLPRSGRLRLDFRLAATPNTAWGTGTADAPPSFGAGPVHFPPTTRASVAIEPGQVGLAPGASAAVDVVVDNSLGAQPATVTWHATAAAGLALTPETATVTVPAGGTGRTAMTVHADPGAAAGFYQIAVTARAANGAVIRTAHLLVTVTRPGESIPTAYVTNYSDATVTPVDTRTRTAGPTIPTGNGPDGVVVTPDNREVYIANNNSNSVTVLSTSDNHVVATVPVGSIAADVDVTPDGRTVWVSNFGDGTAQPIDTATHTAGAPVRVGGNPQRLRIAPGGTRLWVPNQGSGTVSVIDLGTRSTVGEVAVGAAPFGLAFSPDGRTAFVGNTGGNSLSIVDTATLAVTRTVPLGTSPAGLAMAPDGHVLYVTVGTGGVLPVDPATGTAGAFIPTGAGAYDVEFAPDGTVAWVVDTGSNDVRPVAVATGTPGDPIVVGAVPDGIGLSGPPSPAATPAPAGRAGRR
jgi:predicted alpha-1,2-mannosidase